MLTTKPNPVVADVHNRMPAILKTEHFDLWLNPRLKDPARIAGCLEPFDAAL